jgi:hypothetical protein
MIEEENYEIDLFLNDSGVVKISAGPSPHCFESEKDYSYARNHLHPEDAFDKKIVDTEFFSEEEFIIKKNFDREICQKQIEALNHFRTKPIEEDYIKYFSEDFRKKELEERIKNFYDLPKSQILEDMHKVPQEILNDCSGHPVYIKPKYKMPLWAKLKILKFNLKGNKLYSFKKFKKERFKKNIATKKFDLNKYLKAKEIAWMLFVCKWHNFRVNHKNPVKTHYLTKTLDLNYKPAQNTTKSLTYQDLHPKKENKTLIWFVNLKPVKFIETKLFKKYSDKVQDYVLNYIKKDLVFSSYEWELEYYEPKKKKYKKINKKGKPYSVARIG